jgi:HEAT repeat protein
LSESERVSKDAEKFEARQKKDTQNIESRMKNTIPGAKQSALRDVLAKEVALYRKEKAFELLAMGMEDSDARVRKTAVLVLPRVIAQVYEAGLESFDCLAPATGTSAIDIFSFCGLESDWVVEPTMDSRDVAARAMGRVVCPSDVKVLEMLVQRSSNADRIVREVATYILYQVAHAAHTKAMRVILHGMTDSDAAVRRDAVNFITAVASRNNAEHMSRIEKALKDEDASVRLAAGKSKKNVLAWGDKSDLEVFLQHALVHSDAALRRTAVSVVRKMAEEAEHGSRVHRSDSRRIWMMSV